MTDPLIHYPLSIRNGRLFIEDCDTVELAEKFGTPLFVVSEALLVQNARNYQAAFSKHWPEGRARIMAAIKANPITAVRRILTREGIGCDTMRRPGFGHSTGHLLNSPFGRPIADAIGKGSSGLQ